MAAFDSGVCRLTMRVKRYARFVSGHDFRRAHWTTIKDGVDPTMTNKTKQLADQRRSMCGGDTNLNQSSAAASGVLSSNRSV